ncbi:zinc ribbon domain-containing protein [Candidatus Gracilibacteria bacterium]|nr:zinc ribbon domain-containing protein [Candidatus Gracilibacteria bacterium]
MPTYVYACDACGKQFEQFQSFKDEPLKVCRCGEEGKVRRVFQPAGIVFKGSGWYVNDSRGSSSTSATNSSSSETASTNSETAAKDSPTESSSSPEKKSESNSSPAKDSKSESSPAPAATAN